MLSTEFWFMLFYILTGVPAVAFFFYLIIVIYYGRKAINPEKSHTYDQNTKFEPLVSVVAATHNEEMMVGKKIDNLLSSNYPLSKIEIVFADDSDDSTAKIISGKAAQLSNLRLLHFENRMGYSPSMLAGCKATNGEIIILTEASAFLDSDTIPRIVDRLRNPEIGVVTGREVILNVDEKGGKSENLYQRLYNFLRKAETNMDSTFFIKGEATGVRKAAIEGLDVANETFDTAVGLVARSNGYKVVYDPEVRFFDYAPATRPDRIKQKTIRGANLIKILWRFKNMMFNRSYGKYGSLILPSNFALLTLLPVFVLVWFGFLVILTFLGIATAAYFWAAIGVCFLVLSAFSRRLLSTFFEFEYSLISAIYQILLTKKAHDKIEKVASTRRI